MADWNERRVAVLDGVGAFATISPDTVKAFKLASSANAQSGVLGAKTRELISPASR